MPAVDALFEVLAAASDQYDAEPVDILTHGLQCAAALVEVAPDDTELHVAGLVHDIGSVLEPNRPATHAATGAAAVRSVLGDRVARLVAGHDLAKRYLVTTEIGYRDTLSPRSRATLHAQGGRLDAFERAAFEQLADFPALLALRRADDQAKDPHREVAELEFWRDAVTRLVLAQA